MSNRAQVSKIQSILNGDKASGLGQDAKDYIFHFGKYKGWSFERAYNDNKKYLEYIMDQYELDDKLTGLLHKYL